MGIYQQDLHLQDDIVDPEELEKMDQRQNPELWEELQEATEVEAAEECEGGACEAGACEEGACEGGD